MKRYSPTLLNVALLSSLICAATLPAISEPPLSRHLVNAVADGAQPRILVRWLEVDGAAPRWQYFDVLRRTANETSFTQLNDEPVRPLTTAAEIISVFTAPGRSAALSSIIDTLGPDYAERLLQIQSASATGNDLTQRQLLPDQNYAAAVAMGVGLIDESTTAGVTYVYEVWGLDARGVRQERLGTASATALSLRTLAAVGSVSCVDPNDARADMTAFLRFAPSAVGDDQRVAGYDVLRAVRNSDGTCPTIARGLPGVSLVTRFPVHGKSPGDAARGKQLFEASCLSCHAGGRDAAPVKDSTLAMAQRRQFAQLWANGSQAVHDVSGLHALSPEEWQFIYDYVQEFQVSDDGGNTPSAPLTAGQFYCYQVVPRDLFGQHGAGVSSPPICQVKERRPPEQPKALRAERVSQSATTEVCEISWERNSAVGDDTAKYVILRTLDDAPRRNHQRPTAAYAEVIQPASGSRLSFRDTAQTQSDAGRAFFYAVYAKDTGGNASPLTGWAPCTPRDIVAPGTPSIAPQCGTGRLCTSCKNWGSDSKWASQGGDPTFWVTNSICPGEITASASGSPFLYRVERSFDGTNFLPGKDSTSPLVVGVSTMIDQAVSTRVRAIDKSGNIGPASNTVRWIQEGALLPAPQIVSVARLSGGQIKLTFRSLEPAQLLGFVLTSTDTNGDEPTPFADPTVISVQHPLNIGGNVDGSRWAVKPGAQPLSQRINTQCSDLAPGETLCYSSLDQLYYLQAPLADQDEVTLRLRAIGWSGREGNTAPYKWDGWDANDGELDWPVYRSQNTPSQNADATLTLTQLSGPLRVQLSWTAMPDGCNVNTRRFVVYRKRGGGAWQQHSQPFVCDTTQPNPHQMKFIDTDIQTGLTYAYQVYRFTTEGEFQVVFGASQISIP